MISVDGVGERFAVAVAVGVGVVIAIAFVLLLLWLMVAGCCLLVVAVVFDPTP